jgi:hypothetical protein
MKFVILILALICIANAAVYEARNSDDVDFFLEHNPEENGSLLFYNKAESTKPEVTSAIQSVLSIFKNIGEEGRADEAWVDKLQDKVHIMQIDVSNVDNMRVVKEFKVGQTPFLVLLENGNSLMQEVADDETYEHIAEIYIGKQNAAEAAAKKAVDQASITPSSVFPDADYTHKANDDKNAQASIEAAQKAQKSAQDAQKAADEALKALQDARKAFDQHTKLESLKREAEDAKRKAEDAKKQLDEAKKLIADHLADDAKKNNQDNNNQNGQQNQGGNNGQQNQGGNNGQQNQGGNNGQQNQGGYNGQQNQGGYNGQQNQGGNNNQNQGSQQNQQGSQQNQQGSQQNQQGSQLNFPKVTPPPGYTVDYVPVLKPINGDSQSSGYSTVQPSYTSSTPRTTIRRLS